MPLVFIDASSAILLYKTDLLFSCARAFTMAMAEAVFREITVPGYPGAGYFKRMENKQRIRIFGPVSGKTKIQGTARLDKGELETLLLFINCGCSDAFIIMDDGKGARFCRDQNIPFINALLVPKIFWYADRIDTDTFTDRTGRLIKAGRYSEKIIEKAEALGQEDLARFIPHADCP